MTNETWAEARQELIKRVGKNNYVTWIEPLKLAILADGVARFEVPTIFFGDWVVDDIKPTKPVLNVYFGGFHGVVVIEKQSGGLVIRNSDDFHSFQIISAKVLISFQYLLIEELREVL